MSAEREAADCMRNVLPRINWQALGDEEHPPDLLQKIIGGNLTWANRLRWFPFALAVLCVGISLIAKYL